MENSFNKMKMYQKNLNSFQEWKWIEKWEQFSRMKMDRKKNEEQFFLRDESGSKICFQFFPVFWSGPLRKIASPSFSLGTPLKNGCVFRLTLSERLNYVSPKLPDNDGPTVPAQEQFASSCETTASPRVSCCSGRHARQLLFSIADKCAGSSIGWVGTAFKKHGTSGHVLSSEKTSCWQREAQAVYDGECTVGSDGRRMELAIPMADPREPWKNGTGSARADAPASTAVVRSLRQGKLSWKSSQTRDAGTCGISTPGHCVRLLFQQVSKDQIYKKKKPTMVSRTFRSTEPSHFHLLESHFSQIYDVINAECFMKTMSTGFDSIPSCEHVVPCLSVPQIEIFTTMKYPKVLCSISHHSTRLHHPPHHHPHRQSDAARSRSYR